MIEEAPQHPPPSSEPDGLRADDRAAPLIERRVTEIDDPARREAAFLASVTDRPVKVTMPAASYFVTPSNIRATAPLLAGYASEEELQAHMVEVVRQLAQDAIAGGATYLRFDFPAYVYLMDGGMRAQAEADGVDPDV